LTFALSQVPAEKIGMVIGKSGATIKELERLSGCQIWVDAKTNVPG
jgi:polyribonucleotide nucleotidyltransferase